MRSDRFLLMPHCLCLFALVSTLRPVTAQQPENVTSSGAILDQLSRLQPNKPVTDRIPTDYRVGAVYRLKKDVIVECGGTASRVSKYWVSSYDTDNIESVREDLRDPQAAKEHEIRLVRQYGAVLPWDIWSIRHRRETRILLSKGTFLRFQQIWLDRNFEIGVTIHPYVEVLEGPLQGKWVSIHFISDREEGVRPQVGPYCNVNPEYLELAIPATPGSATKDRNR